MWRFQGIDFLWTQTYREIFKSALVYLMKIYITNFFSMKKFYLKNAFLTGHLRATASDT